MNTERRYRDLFNIIRSLMFLLTLLFSALYTGEVSAQDADSLKKIADDLRSQAIRYDRNHDVFNAIVYYSRYLSYENKDIKLTSRLADLYFETRDYAKADEYYDAVISLSPSKDPVAYYRKGMVCMSLGKYDDAIASFAKFKKYYHKRKDKLKYKRLSAIYATSAEWARKNSGSNGNIIITHQGEVLNHQDIDFSPFPVDANTLIYGAVYSDASNQIGPVRQLFKSEKTNGKWSRAQLVEGEINDPAFNTGNAVISEDGNRMYFTRSRKNWLDKDVSELFLSRYDGEKWLKAEKLPFPVNNETYTTTQPALGRNLRTGNEILYFVSDRPGGKGGMDIWYTEFDTKTSTYKNPADLNNKVNTVADEICPYYDNSTQTLYFSSKGMKTQFGGFDIFKTTGSPRKWTDAVILPKPVNSSYDDYYYSILKNNKEGFFTSNRPGSATLDNGTCCDDIYSFRINECVRVHSVGTVRYAMNSEFYKALNDKYKLGLTFPGDNSPLVGVPVELYLSDETGKDDILVSKTSTDISGNYSFELDRDKNYKVLVRNFGYQEKMLPVTTINADCNDTLPTGITLINYLPEINIKINIYYDLDKFDLTGKGRQTINSELLPVFDLIPNGIIEIGSHTDSIGTDVYNENLSQKRSESVVNYLISKGISRERLVAKGYGKKFPVAPNTNADGTDNPDGRQLNRRTEIKIVGEIATPGLPE